MFKTNNTLKELDISWSNVNDNGAVNIAKAIQINTTLLKLDISHNDISRAIAPDLSICFKVNNTLQELIISWNDAETALVYTTTDECYVYVDVMWSYPICYSQCAYIWLIV